MSTSTPTVGTSAGTLTTAGSTSPLQITGLASGLNTNAIIQAEMAEAELPITNMQTQVAGLESQDNTLSSIQSSLMTVQLDTQALGDPTLFNPTQAVTSSDPSMVAATSTNGVGGVIGGSVVTVGQLASASQATFSFTSPSSADTISITTQQGTQPVTQQVSLQAGASSQDLADAINSNRDMGVWAATTSAGQIVLSSRTTGADTSIPTVSDTGSNITALSSQSGQDALYTINNVSGSSPSDTVSSATTGATLTMPGVTLTLNAVTGSSNPVTVSVQQPTANTQAIESAVNQFVQDYNSAIGAIESTISTEPANTASGSTYNPDGGSLFGDPDLEDLLGNLRQSMYTPGAGLPTGMAALTDIGISTGASTGTAQQSSVDGDLVVNQAQLTTAIQSNPSGVEQVLQQWSQSFYSLLNEAAAPSGALAARVQGNGAEISTLNSQISAMQSLYQEQQKAMQEQWAAVEATLSQLQSQGSAFTGSSNLFAANESGTSSTTSSSSSTSSASS